MVSEAAAIQNRRQQHINLVLCVHKHIHIKVLPYTNFRQNFKKIYVIEFQWKI